jgi:chromate transport protein ChrA
MAVVGGNQSLSVGVSMRSGGLVFVDDVMRFKSTVVASYIGRGRRQRGIGMIIGIIGVILAGIVMLFVALKAASHCAKPAGAIAQLARMTRAASITLGLENEGERSANINKRIRAVAAFIILSCQLLYNRRKIQ